MTFRWRLTKPFIRFAVGALCGLLCVVATVFAETLPIKIYTSADGLGSSFVNYLMRDSRGFLWFATRDGLSRFDGHSFITYQIGAKDAPPGIENIFQSRQDVYWITTTGGLYRYDPNTPSPTVSNRTDRPVLNAEYISNHRGSFYEDRSGKLWFLADGLYEVIEGSRKFELRQVDLELPENSTKDFAVKSMAEAEDGSSWLLTTWGLVHRSGDGRQSFYRVEHPLIDALHSMVIDGQGRVWLSRSSGIYVILPMAEPDTAVRDLDRIAQKLAGRQPPFPERQGEIFKFEHIEGSEKNSPKILYRSGDGHIWISTPESLVQFDGQAFSSYSVSEGIAGGVGHMAEDINGNLWIAGAQGLTRLNRQGFVSYGVADGLNAISILTFNQSKDGRFYFGGNDFSVGLFDRRKFRTVRPPLPITARSLWSSNPIFLDSRNNWWFLTFEHLYRFSNPADIGSLENQKPLEMYDRNSGLRGNQMFHIFEDTKADIWVSTRAVDTKEFGFSKFNKDSGKFHTFSQAEGFPLERSVSAFAEDTNGTIWLGFYEGGLAKYSNGRFEAVAEGSEMLNGIITDLHSDRNGRIWLATASSGLNRIDDISSPNPEIFSYRTGNGLSSNNARSITEDNFGRIYVGTARGVDRLDPETGRMKHFSTRDGLSGDFVQTAFRDAGGDVWFGTQNGVSRITPRLEGRTVPPPVWIKSLSIAGDPRTVAELGSSEINDIELEPGQDNLQIEFFGIDFDPSESLRYQYMLEGADQDWNAATEQTTVNYSRLSPGNYRFLVRGVNGDGAASEKPTLVSFRLLPPVWQRWWFIAAVVLMTGAILISFYRYRVAQLTRINQALKEVQRSREERINELERVRTRIARDLHDDVGSSLTQIALYSEVAKQRSPDKSLAREPLEFLVNISNELVDVMSDIVWAINPSKDQLSDLTQRMRHFASEIFTIADIDLEFSAPDIDQQVSLGANLRREVFLIFKESINNIVKHSQATEVKIDLRTANGVLILSINDNGIGFDRTENGDGPFDWEKVRGGNGLLSMERRAVDLGGEYRIESYIGKGTGAVLRVPFGEKK